MESGLKPLHQAALYGTPETLRALIDAGADPAEKTPEGSFPADLALKNPAVGGDQIFLELSAAASN